ncbi:MAG TPA: hypothetical protein PKI46_02870 [Bacteroidales bacterium]|nr:hypothetical protein [Bacteroidales bacterium]
MIYEYYCESCDKIIEIEKSMTEDIPAYIVCEECNTKCYRVWGNMAIKIPEHMKATSDIYYGDNGSNLDYLKKRMNKRPSGKEKVYY